MELNDKTTKHAIDIHVSAAKKAFISTLD